MKTKEKIVETLEGRRVKQVWELIEKAIKEMYTGNIKIPKRTKKEYLSYDNIINDKTYRYLVVEQYNYDDGFYFQYHEDGCEISTMFDDYFHNQEGSTGWEPILLVDMKEMKCYLLDKEIKYHQKEVKIK